MKNNIRLILLLPLLLVSLMWSSGCSSISNDAAGADTLCTDSDSLSLIPEPKDTLLQLTQMQADSLAFRLSHHYQINYNFRIKADSIMLVPLEGDLQYDTCMVYSDDLVAVANIKYEVGDSIDSVWVKVARDQQTMGWVPESELLANVTPDDPISEIIDFLTHSRSVWMSVLVVLGIVGFYIRKMGRATALQKLRFDDLDSIYSPLFLVATSCLASLYASIQNFAPEFWQEYYYHPTLNPLTLPFVMAMLVILVWLVIILFVAIIIDVYEKLFAVRGLSYVLQVLGLAMMSYLFISWTTRIYVGYLILPCYILLIAGVYSRYVRMPYLCGSCGEPMHEKGVCPNCGTLNK